MTFIAHNNRQLHRGAIVLSRPSSDVVPFTSWGRILAIVMEFYIFFIVVMGMSPEEHVNKTSRTGWRFWWGAGIMLTFAPHYYSFSCSLMRKQCIYIYIFIFIYISQPTETHHKKICILLTCIIKSLCSDFSLNTQAKEIETSLKKKRTQRPRLLQL